jgi:enoyl-CoA hydratase/carnithine racemase
LAFGNRLEFLVADLSSIAVSSEVHASVVIQFFTHFTLLRLNPVNDPTNRLSRKLISELGSAIDELATRAPRLPLILTGNETFFSVGADLNEIAAFTPSQAYEFAQMGQRTMNSIASHPSGAVAAIGGYCMGGGLDLALACHYRLAHPRAVFGHRGAALGIITGFGGTQRLPRLIGKAWALQLFLMAEKIDSQDALRLALIDKISNDPLQAAMRIAESCAAPVS